MSNRIDKVNSLLEHEISKLIARDFNFPETIVTLTHVDTTANLIEARSYISVFPEGKADNIIKILNSGVHDIQKKINKMLNMRPIPKIIFVKDENVSQAAKVEELLGKLKNDRK